MFQLFIASILSITLSSNTIVFNDRIDIFTITPIVVKLKTGLITDVYLTTGGGDVGSGLYLLKQLNKHNPTLHIRYRVASMGAVILCAYKGDKDIPNNIVILFHTIRHNNKKITDKNVHTFDTITQRAYQRVKQLIYNNCGNAFTKDEWVSMWVYGKDIIMTGKTYKKRVLQ